MPKIAYKIKERRCRICNTTSKDFKDIPFRYYNENGDWDGKSYRCNKCYKKDRYHRVVKFDPDSINNIIKSLSDFRNGNLYIHSKTGKSIIDQAVVAKYLGTEDLNIKMNNFGWYIDIENKEYGKIDVKGSTLYYQRYIDLKGYTSIYYIWTFNNNRKIDCDYYFCLGYDEKRKNIDSVFVIPNDAYIFSLSTISVRKGHSKYDKFRVDSTAYNDIYQNLKQFLGDKRFFGIEDIKKWMKLMKR